MKRTFLGLVFWLACVPPAAAFNVTRLGLGGGTVPAIVQILTSHGVASMNPNGSGGSSTTCTWTLQRPIRAGDTVVGYIHTSDTNDASPLYPAAITDNLGHTYTLSPGVDWTSFPEDIGLWYLKKIQGNPNTFTFNYSGNVPTGHTLGFCDAGITEYQNVNSIVVVNPVLIASSNTSPSLTINPNNNPSLVWAFASPFVQQDNSSQTLSSPANGYNVIINNDGDSMDVWGNNSLVSTPQTLTWN